ncbi:MAG: hypothetical protein QE487_02790 [Fluviicola sp.]|nr:hypothetical protein [Fluviicola sp.]
MGREKTTISKGDFYFSVVAFMLLAFFFLFVLVRSINTLLSDIQPSEITTVKGVILNNAEITRVRTSRSIRIKIKEAPRYEFVIGYPHIDVTTTRQYVNEVTRFDTIELDILTTEYQAKISQTAPLKMMDRIGFYSIQVYGLREGNVSFLNLADYNKADDENAGSTIWLSSFLVLLFLGWSMYIMTFKRPKKATLFD